MDLRFYWRQMCKRPWLILALVVVSLILGGLKVAKTRPVYQATSKLLIEQNNPRVNPFEELATSGKSAADSQTQYQILRSRVLARRVIAKLKLRNHPEFAPQFPQQPRAVTQSLVSWIDSLLDVFSPPPLETLNDEFSKGDLSVKPAPDTVLVNAFLGRLQVEPMSKAHLVKVGFQAHDPGLASRVANTLADLYIDFDRETRFTVLQDALDWLERQVGDMRQQVEASEQALQQYKDEHDVHLIDDRLPGLMHEIATLNAALVQAKTERIELDTLYQALQSSSKKDAGAEWMPAVVENQLIQNLKTRYIDLHRTFVHLGQKYGDEHPRTLQIQAQLKELSTKIDLEIQRIVAAFNTKYQVVRARENALRSHIEGLKQDVRQLNDKSVQYGVLKREANSNRRLGDLLLNRLKETSVSADLTNGNHIRVIDVAEVPTNPINVRPMRTLGIAGILGLLAGVGLVGLMGYLDNTLKSPEEAEEFLGLPVAGIIERFRATGSGNDGALVTLDSPHTKVTEAFKTLRANLLLSYADQPRKVYLVTSPHSHDGKTTVAVNLAIVLAQTERRVLLIDADLRHPSIHKRFGIDNREGLRERALTETYNPTEVVSHDSIAEGNLSIITSGKELPNPSELLESKRMERFLAHAREHYDVVIIDTPPVMAVSDALVLSPMADSILMVLRASVTPYDHAQRAVSAFLTLHAEPTFEQEADPASMHQMPHMGLVLNLLDPREGGAYDSLRYANYYGNREA